jgi:hypothetical protein
MKLRAKIRSFFVDPETRRSYVMLLLIFEKNAIEYDTIKMKGNSYGKRSDEIEPRG